MNCQALADGVRLSTQLEHSRSVTAPYKTINSASEAAFINRLKKNCFRFTLIESQFRDIFRHSSVTDTSKGAGGSASVIVTSNPEVGSMTLEIAGFQAITAKKG